MVSIDVDIYFQKMVAAERQKFEMGSFEQIASPVIRILVL